MELEWRLLQGAGVTDAPFDNLFVKDSFDFVKVDLLGSLNGFHILRVWPQLDCGNTCQIWTWYSLGNQFIDEGENS